MSDEPKEQKQLELTITQQNAIVEVLSHVYTLLYGGSRSGKSFTIMFLMLMMANKYKSRHLIARFHFSEVKKSIIKETLPEVASLMGITYNLNQQDWYITLSNGSEIWFCGVDDARGMDRVLGKEYLWIWFNEASNISYSSYTTVLTRLAQQVFKTDAKGKFTKDTNGKKVEVPNRVILDENPPRKSHWTFKLFFDNIEPDSRTLLTNPEEYGTLQMNASGNIKNISESYIKRLEGLPLKERKRFLLGEFADDIAGSLFTEKDINQYRIISHPDLVEIIISIDPATTATATSDETGIIVVARDINDRGYVLEDKSGIYTPSEWAKIAVKLYDKYDATYILGEENQGGLMVSHTIQSEDHNVPVKLVRATKGKILRAEPISSLYSNGRISHVGAFPDLEDEMTCYTGGASEKSPNRLDALVHGFTALFPIGRSIESEYFRDKLAFMPDDQSFENSINFGYIRITGSANYNFTFLCVKIKNNRAYITDVIFNESFPSDNMDGVSKIVLGNEIETLYIEAPISYASFVRDVVSMNICVVRGIKGVDDNENRVLIESKSIIDKFAIKKSNQDGSYKDFISQVERYTSLASKDESFAPEALSGCASVLNKIYYYELQSTPNDTNSL